MRFFAEFDRQVHQMTVVTVLRLFARLGLLVGFHGLLSTTSGLDESAVA